MIRLSRTTTADELQTIPGIGERLALAIVAYLRHADALEREDDLRHVPQIGPKRLAQLKPYVRVYGPSASEVAESEALYHELGLR